MNRLNFSRKTTKLRNGRVVTRLRPVDELAHIIKGHRKSAHSGKFVDNCAACRALADELNLSLERGNEKYA